MNSNTQVCSDHFVSAAGRRLRPDEYPTRNLPVITAQSTASKPRKPPKVRTASSSSSNSDCSSEEDVEPCVEQIDVETQTYDDPQAVIEELKERTVRLEEAIAASK